MEYLSSSKGFDFEKEIARLRSLSKNLKASNGNDDGLPWPELNARWVGKVALRAKISAYGDPQGTRKKIEAISLVKDLILGYKRVVPIAFKIVHRSHILLLLFLCQRHKNCLLISRTSFKIELAIP
ncbi:hypothetical protein Droror1_Dr00020137 [Drosera rotundifolia]